MIALEIARAVRQNLKRPTHQRLAQPTLLRAISDCQRRLLREAQLSDRGWLETNTLITPASLDDPLAVDNFSIPTRVEYRVNPNVDDWFPVSIVNNDGFSSISGDAVAFYGSPTRITYSAASINDLVGREYRLWYETAPAVISQLTQEVGVAEIFSDLLTDEATLYCLPLVEDDSEAWVRWARLQGALTADRLSESKKQWKKWLTMSRDNGIVYADPFQPSYGGEEAAFIGANGILRAT